jgi:hypothetical protein
MAERFIETIPVFRNSLCGATGVAGTIYSDPIDLRDIFRLGITSLSYSIGATGATAGSTLFSYSDCAVYNGTYREAGTFGTQGVTKGQSGNINFTIVATPFMKVRCISGTSAHALITAELNVR